MTYLDNQRPGGPSDTNRCFICGSSTHFIRDCPQVKQQNQDQGSRQAKKDKRKKQRNKRKRQDEQAKQEQIDHAPPAELPEDALETMATVSTPNLGSPSYQIKDE